MFEVWILLHKQEFYSPTLNKNDYLKTINKCFNTKFERLGDFKKKDNFQRICKDLTFGDLKTAISNARRVQDRNQKKQTERVFGKYAYFITPPATNIHIIFEEILNECIGKGKW